jgi:hypothetical protein
MTANDMQMRLQFLKTELERQLHVLERQILPPQAPAGDARRRQKANVGKILLELGSLQMRLMEAGRR